MPKGQSPRSSMLARYKVLQAQMKRMEPNLDRVEDAPNATTGEKLMRGYRNTMISIGEQLNKANPAYRSIGRRLTRIENSLDTNAEKLSRK